MTGFYELWSVTLPLLLAITPSNQGFICSEDQNVDFKISRTMKEVAANESSVCCVHCHNTPGCVGWVWRDMLNENGEHSCRLKSLMKEQVLSIGTVTGRIERNCVDEQSDCALNGQWSCDGRFFPRQYTGKKNRTRKGLLCQRWDSFTPHIPLRKYQTRLAEWKWNLGSHRECRVADLDAPWCYVESEGIRWDYCFNPCEDCVEVAGNRGERCVDPGKAACRSYDGYQGKRSKTKNKVNCAYWGDARSRGLVADHEMQRWLMDGGHNYCRIGDKSQPWCFVAGMPHEDFTWDYCFETCAEFFGRLDTEDEAAFNRTFETENSIDGSGVEDGFFRRTMSSPFVPISRRQTAKPKTKEPRKKSKTTFPIPERFPFEQTPAPNLFRRTPFPNLIPVTPMRLTSFRTLPVVPFSRITPPPNPYAATDASTSWVRPTWPPSIPISTRSRNPFPPSVSLRPVVPMRFTVPPIVFTARTFYRKLATTPSLIEKKVTPKGRGEFTTDYPQTRSTPRAVISKKIKDSIGRKITSIANSDSLEIPEPFDDEGMRAVPQETTACERQLICANKGRCIQEEGNLFSCQCQRGWVGILCEYEDFCVSSPCPPDMKCLSGKNQNGTYACEAYPPT